jgi:hypothetical protein
MLAGPWTPDSLFTQGKAPRSRDEYRAFAVVEVVVIH